MPIAGWCPKNGRAENHEDPADDWLLRQYPELRETDRADYNQRTTLNVRDADATIVIYPSDGKISPGTQLTISTAKKLKKPYFLLGDKSVSGALKWLNKNFQGDIEVNFAGPRASEVPGVYDIAKSIVTRIIG
jgi:hypothetical protein